MHLVVSPWRKTRHTASEIVHRAGVLGLAHVTTPGELGACGIPSVSMARGLFVEPCSGHGIYTTQQCRLQKAMPRSRPLGHALLPSSGNVPPQFRYQKQPFLQASHGATARVLNVKLCVEAPPPVHMHYFIN